MFKILDGRGGGGGGGARLAGSLRSEEDDDDRSCPSGPSGGGRFRWLLDVAGGRGLEGAVTVNRSVFWEDASWASFSNLDLRFFTACRESESMSADSIPPAYIMSTSRGYNHGKHAQTQ